MPITKRLITATAVLMALVAAVALGAGYPLTPVPVAEGHDGSNYDGTGHARGEHHAHVSRAWKNGSRCIYPDHVADKHTQNDGTLVLGMHTGFSSAGYTTGPAEGTGVAKNLVFSKEHISNVWEVQLGWRASHYQGSDGTWGCQPYKYQAQRKLSDGSWERWVTSHPNSNRFSETRSQRKQSLYGYRADYSLYKHPTTGTPEIVQFRICNVDRNDVVGACTSPKSTQLGGDPWNPSLSVEIANKPIWEDTASIRLGITTSPPPPHGATTVTLSVGFNVDKMNEDFETATTHNVHISSAGTGSFSVSNPHTRTGADFTEDATEQMRVKLTDGANAKPQVQLAVNILDDDPIPITVYLPNDNPAIYAVDGPGSKPATLNPSGSTSYARRFQVGFTSPESIATGTMGETRCPKLAGDWNLTFASNNTSVVNDQTLGFGCNRSKDATVKAAGSFRLTPGAVFTHGTQGWTRPVSLAGDASFSGTVYASNDQFPSKLGVGFSASRSTVDEGSDLTLTVNGHDYQDRHDPASCDPSGRKYDVLVDLIDANSAAVDGQKTVQVSRHCSADAVFSIPHGSVGTLTASFDIVSTNRNVEERGGYAVQFVTVNPDSTNLRVSTSALSVNEGSSSTLTFRLTAAPTADVTVGTECRKVGDFGITCSGTTGTLTFTTANWAQPQTITITANHDNHTSNRSKDFTWTAESADPHYDGEKATVTITKVDDDQGPPLRFASGISTSLSRNDRVTLRVELPSYNPEEDACRISYVNLWTHRENLVSDDEHEHPHSTEINTYYRIPKPGEYTGGVYEYVGEYANGDQYIRVRHYQDGRDSDLEIYDDTPGQSKNGRIKLYAISSVTKCQGGIDQWTSAPTLKTQTECNAVGNSNSWKLCRWVNYSAD